MGNLTNEKFAQSFDAKDWAKAFMEIMGDRRDEIDEEAMIGWFANAIMRGYDEYPARNDASAIPATGSSAPR